MFQTFGLKIWTKFTFGSRHGYFQEKNEYGVDIQKNGRPLPVEYLLVVLNSILLNIILTFQVDVPAGMPKDPCSTFYQPKHVKFHIENRTDIGETQVFFFYFFKLWSTLKILTPANRFFQLFLIKLMKSITNFIFYIATFILMVNLFIFAYIFVLGWEKSAELLRGVLYQSVFGAGTF